MTLFIIISTLILLLVTLMIFLKTPIETTLCLCTILLFSTILLFLLQVEFMSYIFIMVYVGGIVLLFLFVIIMLNLKVEPIKTNKKKFKLLSGPVLNFFFVLKFQSFISMRLEIKPIWFDADQSEVIKQYHFISNDIANFSLLLYTHFFFYLLLVGVILLLAMIGVLVLSLNSNKNYISNNCNFDTNNLSGKTSFSYQNWKYHYTWNTNYDMYENCNVSILPLENFISFSMTVFSLSMVGITFNKQKNFLVVMLFFELMLFSLSFLSIVFSMIAFDPKGQIFSLLIMSIAVAESAVGLGILIALFRLNKRVDLDSFSYLRG